MYRKHDFLPFN